MYVAKLSAYRDLLPNDAMQSPPMPSCITFVHSVKTNIILKFFFHHRVATPFKFFHIKRHGDIPTGNPLTGALNAGGIGSNISISDQYLASSPVVNLSTLRPARCYQHGTAGPWQVVTLIACSKRRSLLMAGDDNEIFMTRSPNVT